MSEAAILALEDGSVFHGRSIGAPTNSVGEVVFNTAMTGYQEILTDPSYAQQLVTLTYPHIGNTGCNDVDNEAERPMATGLIVRDLPRRHSSWRSQRSLGDYLTASGVAAIAGIDTRRLTRILRTKGALNGCLLATANCDPSEALQAARRFPGLQGMDVAQQVSTKRRYEWLEGGFDLDTGTYALSSGRLHVVAYDFGIKRNILRLLAQHGCRVTVVPARTPAEEVLALSPNGVFLSNGPGDPEPCTYAIDAIRTFLERRLPLFGICLGYQLLGLAAGAKTEKMKCGHHGANHPVEDLADGRVLITSQNHGFAVAESSLPSGVVATHRSLFDQTLQGIRVQDRPAFGFQGHPEASPGPHDIAGLFDQFRQSMTALSRSPA